MLKVKSFKMSDDEGINALLDEYRLATGAHILISNGELVVPYEDGEPINENQRKITIKENINTTLSKIDVIIHTQSVLKIQEQGIQDEIKKLDEQIVFPDGKKHYEQKKELSKLKQRLESTLDQTRNMIIQNQAELTRLRTEIAVYEEVLSKLESQDEERNQTTKE